MSNRAILLILLLAPLCGPASASEVTSSSPADTRRSAIFFDGIDPQAWDLSQEETERYRTLMSGIRGSFSHPTISPLEVLGIHARTPDERRRYAERLVRLLYEDTERVLAFQREVQAAWERLYGDVPIIETDKLPPDKRPFSSESVRGKRLAAFVATTCFACDQAMPRLLALADGETAGVDFYVIDTASDAAIRAWARRHRIPVETVKTRRITLNHGRSLFARLGGTTVPAVFVREGDTFTPVPTLSASTGGGRP